MKLTIVKDDNLVVKDGIAYHINLDGMMPDDIYSVQWNNKKGEIEYLPDNNGNKKLNKKINDITQFNNIISLWETVHAEKQNPTPPEPTLPDNPTLKEYAVMKRYEKETGGINFFGIPIYTDDRSKLMIMGARIRAENNIDTTEEWVDANGVIHNLDSAQIILISDAIAAHVSSCFRKYAEVVGKIDLQAISEFSQIDEEFEAI